MSSEQIGQTPAVSAGEAAAAPAPAAARGDRKCLIGDRHIQRDDLRKAWKECREESFWYRALPLSLGSMAVTGGLIYNVAGILGFVVGRASYAGTCRSKFQKLGLGDGAGFGPWSFGGPFGPFKKSGHGHRCHHVGEECKKKAPAAPAEEVKN